MVTVDETDYLEHYGILRRSGRYPWGSGNNRSEIVNGFLATVADMRSKGLTDTQIANGLGLTTTQLRAANSIAKNEKRQSDIGMATRLKDKGYSNTAVAERLGISEATVRNYLKPGAKEKADILTTTANMLREQVDGKEYVDVGAGVENLIGVSENRLKTALAVLREDGYEVHSVKIRQQGTGLETTMKVLVKPGVTQKEAWLNRGKIQQVTKFSEDKGRSFHTVDDDLAPLSIDPKRVGVRYAEEGGRFADGVIYVRPGVQDISIGNNHYAQVRVKVGEDNYLKGMAMYKNDLPEGVDLLFNTNKSDTGNKLDAMKDLEPDPKLPFGSVVKKQIENRDTPDAKVVSAMNLVNVEGDWTKWRRNISSQALSKQSPALAKKQLDMTYESRKAEFDEIMALTNPVVREKLLTAFADGTDAAAVHLRAAALERQNWNVILPVESIKPSEIYAPNYRNGERVALIRYPHGGKFEIPELTVNNRQPEAKAALGDAKDAVGIHHTVAEHLSGADFDGDTVLVIPQGKHGKLETEHAIAELKEFDPRSAYPAYEGMPKLSPDRKQRLMGDVSNLITDMTLRGAPTREIVKAVKHSMVVIDAERHDLNYKQSAIDNGIRSLKEKYQGRPDAGAATLISLKKSTVNVPDRKLRPQSEGGPIDPKTGRKVYVPTGKTRVNKDGDRVEKTIRVRKLAEAEDAHSLVSSPSGTPMEHLYADHSNRLKELAGKARIEASKTPTIKQSSSAKKVYAKQLASLNSKLALANINRPLERQAQVIASETVKARRAANPALDGDTLKKVRFQALEDARARTGAKKQQIKIEPDEWEAIQSRAVSTSKLKQILANADIDRVRELATPRPDRLMTTVKTARAEQMLASGYTRAEVADHLGVSVSTLDVATSGIFKEG